VRLSRLIGHNSPGVHHPEVEMYVDDKERVDETIDEEEWVRSGGGRRKEGHLERCYQRCEGEHYADHNVPSDEKFGGSRVYHKAGPLVDILC
jgi:hypothetical protein